MLYAMLAEEIPSNFPIQMLKELSDRPHPVVDLAGKASALESALIPLEASFDRIENWLIGFTILVVVGLIIEYWDEVRELRTAIKERRSGLSIARHTSSVGRFSRAVFGGILVTVGVAGELLEEFNGTSVAVKIRDLNEKLDRLFQQVSVDQQSTIISLQKELQIADMRLADRIININDFPRFLDATGAGPHLRIFVLKGDREAKTFAQSLLQITTEGRPDPNMNDHITEIEDPRDAHGFGTMLPGVFGPSVSAKADPRISQLSVELSVALSGSKFCVTPNFAGLWELSALADRTPGVITLIIGPKDRAHNCR